MASGCRAVAGRLLLTPDSSDVILCPGDVTLWLQVTGGLRMPVPAWFTGNTETESSAGNRPTKCFS